MRFNSVSFRMWTARALMGATLCISIGTALFAFAKSSQSADQYDPQESISKLRAIGAALQLYRAEYGVLPVEQRNHYWDAGLPPNLTALCAGNGKPWKLPPVQQSFRISHPRHGGRAPELAHFATNYWPPKFYSKLGDLSNFFKTRGEKLPILFDQNYETKAEMHGNAMAHILVLRLDGTVEVVKFDHRGGMLDIHTR